MGPQLRTKGMMKYFLSILFPLGFVHSKPQDIDFSSKDKPGGFDFTSNCKNGAICSTNIDIKKNVQIFHGFPLIPLDTESGEGEGAAAGGITTTVGTIPARPSLNGDCNYDCSGWPYAQCKMSIKSQFRSASATCINPFPRGSSTKYSNYPECATVPDGCERCSAGDFLPIDMDFGVRVGCY